MSTPIEEFRSDELPVLGAEVVGELRRRRRRRRTEELEWFEVAYRVYMIAIVGIVVVVWLSGVVQDEPLSPAGVADLRATLPAVGGLIAAVALFLGLRSGSRGGPIAIEQAEVQHLLLAPIPRRAVLRRPTVQRARSVVGAAAIVGAVAGQLAGKRLPGTSEGWAAAGAAAAAVAGGIYVVAAVAAHGLGISEAWATLIGSIVLAVEGLAVAEFVPAGPLDTVGGLARWGIQVELVDLLAPLVVVAAFVACLPLVERFSLEMMSRRSALVAQLRFAVTLQDVRTVMLLRRQLSLEQNRERPWFTIGRRGPAPWRRSVRSLARFPLRRVGRMALLSAVAGAAQVAAFRGTTPMVLVSGLACFLLGLEALEPLAQELDHPDLTESYPITAGRLHQRLLAAPGLFLVLLAVPGAVVAAALEWSAGGLAVAALLAAPAALVGGCGAALNTIGGAPDPFQADREGAFLPPEVAGIHLMFKVIRPPIVATLGSLPVLLVREAPGWGEDPVSMAVRGALGALVLVAWTVWWIERRETFRRWWRKVLDDGKKAPRSNGATT